MIRLNLADNTATLRLEDQQLPCRLVEVEPGVLDIELPVAEDSGTIRLGGQLLFFNAASGRWRSVAGAESQGRAEEYEHRRNEILRLYDQGLSRKEICGRTGYGRTKVADILRRWRPEPENFTKGAHTDKYPRVRELAALGMSMTKIADTTGTPRSTVRSLLKREDAR